MAHIFMLIPLLALLFFVFLPWQVALALYMPVAIGSLAVARKVMQAQREPPASGREAMMGDTAVVVSTDSNRTEVHYHGETWRAVSLEPLHVDQRVVIEAVEGLTLRVAPYDKIRTESGGELT